MISLMYAEVDGFDSDQAMAVSEFVNPLDIWLVSRVHQVRNQITEGMEAYNIPAALSSVLEFIDDMSNWFVRRSRRRFWKSEDDQDKLESLFDAVLCSDLPCEDFCMHLRHSSLNLSEDDRRRCSEFGNSRISASFGLARSWRN